jgi:hypothetical protein
MEFCVDAKTLRAALAEIEAAEANGFMHCLAVLKFRSVGPMVSDNRAEYSDILERAHPTDGRLNWGRFQRVSARHKFEDGKLVPLAQAA